jgi:tRNA-dependent cyclodipeptide synthase
MSGSKAIQYPAQTGNYAVKVKNGAGWQGSSTARLHISVGQEYHKGEKLKATFNWVSNRFDKVIICVNDTLQRYNLEYQGMSPEDAYRVSEIAGSKWIEENLSAIRSMNTTVQVFRWEDWTGHPDYASKLEEVNALYQDNKTFRDEMDQEIIEYWERNKESFSGDFDKFRELSTSYFLEETTAFFLMYDEETAVNVYPGSTLFPNKFHDNDGGFTRIDFRKNQRVPQVA